VYLERPDLARELYAMGVSVLLFRSCTDPECAHRQGHRALFEAAVVIAMRPMLSFWERTVS
jgi:hypothetical protein